MKVVPVTVGLVNRSSGAAPPLESRVSTVSSERSASVTDGLNSTVQVTVTVDPTDTGLEWLLVMVTDSGAGAEEKLCIQNNYGTMHTIRNCYGIYVLVYI